MTQTVQDKHAQWMQLALGYARQGLGRTAPNPSVGCVIVKNGKILGIGRTGDGGRPHAEVNALAMALNTGGSGGRTGADLVRGADVYVTLEPCAFTGKTPPCTRALIQAGVARVFIACQDPHDRVDGRGVAQLRDADIVVETGLLADEAWALNKGFFLSVLHDRPLVTLKMATTLDGKVATQSLSSQWITDEKARLAVHALRGRHDAILCGIGTVLKDNPMLTTRVPGLVHKPLRVVLDSSLRIPLDGRLVQSVDSCPLLVICDEGKVCLANKREKRRSLVSLGVQIEDVADLTNNLTEVLSILGRNGVTRLLVEGGTQVYTSFVRTELFDELIVFRAPSLIGGDGYNMLNSLDVIEIGDKKQLTLCDKRQYGPDVMECYVMRHCGV